MLLTMMLLTAGAIYIMLLTTTGALNTAGASASGVVKVLYNKKPFDCLFYVLY